MTISLMLCVESVLFSLTRGRRSSNTGFIFVIHHLFFFRDREEVFGIADLVEKAYEFLGCEFWF
jgi:hypothetical protein